jgi:tetratricopeptide (TPR) repeat protein
MPPAPYRPDSLKYPDFCANTTPARTNHYHYTVSPKRPRSHILEDESRQRFPLVLPSAWVVREIPKDYGIDLEVEVFEDEEATGLTFKVQLKSTDAVKASIPKLQIDMDHLRYWSMLDVAVMIALYVQEESTFYWRWSRGVDAGLTKSTKKSTVVDFESGDTLSMSVSPRIAGDLKVFRDLNQRILPRPLRIRLTSTLNGLSTGKLVTNFRQWVSAKNLRGRLEVVVGDSPYQAQIALTPQSWRVSLPLNAASLTLHGQHRGPDIEAECGALLASLLANAGFAELAIALFQASIRNATIWHSSAVLDAIVRFIARHGEYDLGIAAAESLWRDGGLGNYNHITDVMSHIAMNSVDLAEDTASAAAQILLEVAAAALHQGESKLAGIVFFNAAGIVRHRNPAHAADLFTWAVELKPEYGLEARFWMQRGACLFRAGFPQQSADDYMHALLLDPNWTFDLTPDCADALLYAGRFADCIALLDQTDTISHRLDRLVVVDKCTAQTIMNLTGLERQERRGDTQEESIITDPIAFLIEYDSLNAVAWERLTQATPKANLELLISNARIQCKSSAAWVAAAIEAFASPAESRTRKAILEQGLVDGFPDFYEGVRQAARDQLTTDQSRELFLMLDAQAESATEHRLIPWIFSSTDQTPAQNG